MNRASADRGTQVTPDSRSFPTRSYDLVKEFSIALAVIVVLTFVLAAVFSSPDEKAISLQAWAQAAPNDVIATATAELAGTSTSASYGAPYNTNDPGQALGPLDLQRWAGVRIPIDSANDLVLAPLRTMTRDTAVTSALSTWDAATPDQQQTWARSYADALTASSSADPSTVAGGDYGPVPALAQGELTLATAGSLEGLLTTETTFYGGDSTKPLLLLADGTYLEDLAVAQHLGGDQWGMMNGSESYPGQPWLWLYTFWYQIEPFASSGNADALRLGTHGGAIGWIRTAAMDTGTEPTPSPSRHPPPHLATTVTRRHATQKALVCCRHRCKNAGHVAFGHHLDGHRDYCARSLLLGEPGGAAERSRADHRDRVDRAGSTAFGGGRQPSVNDGAPQWSPATSAASLSETKTDVFRMIEKTSPQSGRTTDRDGRNIQFEDTGPIPFYRWRVTHGTPNHYRAVLNGVQPRPTPNARSTPHQQPAGLPRSLVAVS